MSKEYLISLLRLHLLDLEGVGSPPPHVHLVVTCVVPYVHIIHHARMIAS